MMDLLLLKQGILAILIRIDIKGNRIRNYKVAKEVVAKVEVATIKIEVGINKMIMTNREQRDQKEPKKPKEWREPHE